MDRNYDAIIFSSKDCYFKEAVDFTDIIKIAITLIKITFKNLIKVKRITD